MTKCLFILSVRFLKRYTEQSVYCLSDTSVAISRVPRLTYKYKLVFISMHFYPDTSHITGRHLCSERKYANDVCLKINIQWIKTPHQQPTLLQQFITDNLGHFNNIQHCRHRFNTVVCFWSVHISTFWPETAICGKPFIIY